MRRTGRGGRSSLTVSDYSVDDDFVSLSRDPYADAMLGGSCGKQLVDEGLVFVPFLPVPFGTPSRHSFTIVLCSSSLFLEARGVEVARPQGGGSPPSHRESMRTRNWSWWKTRYVEMKRVVKVKKWKVKVIVDEVIGCEVK